MHDLPLLTTIAAAFAAAWLLGLLTQRIGLSPIVGYLLAGIVIGPYTGGFVGDVHLAQQLAELGVIFMMFGVGLHFHLKDLLAVKHVAVPGAIGQSLVATLLTVLLFRMFGWSFTSTLVLGMAMAVASTVVLLRVLMDRSMLNTVHGHVAVGWLIVEDVLTVLALVFVPMLAIRTGVEQQETSGLATIGWAIAKLAVLVALLLVGGKRAVPWILSRVAKLRSNELFTLTVLVLSIAVAVGSAAFFGASVALGAFLAGMVVAQSPASHQAASNVLPMRDAFAVLFFVSVGMLFDPSFLLAHPLMVASGLTIVLIGKPLAAMVIVASIGYPVRTALTVAIGLAQIGEFSFILMQVAREHDVIPHEATQVVVATAMISITLNPLLFGTLNGVERLLRRSPVLWRLLNARAHRRASTTNDAARPAIAGSEGPLAIVVGFGPVGRLVDGLLRDAGFETVIVDLNIETVEAIHANGRLAIFGDAASTEVLGQTGIERAAHLLITLSQSGGGVEVVRAARALNPAIEVTVRAGYLGEREALLLAGASTVVFEEGEAGIAMARHVMDRQGMDPIVSERLLSDIRRLWRMQE